MFIAPLLVLSAALPQSDWMSIVTRIAGAGKPDCVSLQRDGARGPCLPIVAVSGDRAVNASSQGALVTFTSGAVTRLNQDEFALLAGHEIAHYYLGHTGQSVSDELAADRLGAELACQAGYDPKAGLSILRFVREGGAHPRRSMRRDAVLSIDCPLS